MNLKALRTLVEVHDSPSFQEAAKRLEISQSSISNHIRALEDELGVELFDRSVRPPSITLAGRSMVETARQILALMDKLRSTASSFSLPSKPLHLGVIPTATARLIPNSLVSLSKLTSAPAITLETGLSGSLIKGVQDHVLDAAIITQPRELPKTIVSELIYRERLAIVAKTGNRNDLEIKKLSKLPFLRFDRRFGIGQIIDKFLTSRNVSTRDIMQLDTVDAILAMVVKGIGVSIVPERSIAEHHRSHIDVVPIDSPDATRDVSLIWASSSELIDQITILKAALKATESA